MKPRIRAIVLIIIAASIAALVFSLLLLKSVKAAIILYSSIVGLTALVLEPFIGLVNYLVFLYVRPQEFIPGFVGMPVMLMVGGATLIIMLLHFAAVKKSLVLVKIPQNILILVFVAAIAMSHLSHLNLHGAFDSTREFLSIVVMYFVIVNLVTSETKAKIILYLLSFLTLFLAVQGIYQFFTGTGWGGQTMIQGRIRSIGIFADPNDLALTFLIIIPFALFILLDARNMLLKILSLAALVVLIYALYLTGSRGGFIGLGLLVFLLFSRRYGLAPGLIVAAAAFILIFALGPSRLSQLSPQEESAYGRIEAWGAGLEMLKSNLLFGVGAGRFLDYHIRTAHNSIVLCAGELGLFGLYTWLLLILVSMRNLFFISSEASDRGMTTLVLLSDSLFFGFTAYLTAAFFLSRTYNDLLYILIGMSGAVTSIFIVRTGEKYALLEKRDFIYAFILMFLALLLLKLITRLYW